MVTIVVGLIVGATAVLWYRERSERRIVELRLVRSEREVSQLAGRLKEMSDAASNAALHMTRAEPPSISSNSVVSQARTDTAAAAGPKEIVEATKHRTDEKPKSEMVPLVDQGSSTPSATITSMQWAMSTYNPATLAGLIYIADSDRRELESVMSRLSADQQAVYKSPEQLLSTLLCDPRNMKELSGIRVLSEDRVDRDHSVVRIEASDNAGNLLQAAYYLHKTADGWKWVISSASVREAAATLQRDAPRR